MAGGGGYEIEAGSLWRAGRKLFGPVSVLLPAGSITALLGPGGSGKSSLLAALGGAPPIERRGRWSLGGQPLAPAERWAFTPERTFERQSAGQPDVLWVEQLVRSLPLPEAQDGWARMLRVLSGSSSAVWLLDEPTVGAPEFFDRELRRLIEAQRGQRTVVMATHDQSLARLADQVLLLTDDHSERHDARVFFEAPPTPLAAKYVRTGSCWPSPPPLASMLPAHFHWIVPERLAGMGRPGLTGEADDDLAALQAAGVSLLVSLTEAPFPAAQLHAFGIEGRHLPIRDMGLPPTAPTARLCRYIETRIKSGDRVALHCHAGLGRTGTVAAAFLVWQGQAPDDAIAAVRAINPRFIQTPEQERFLHLFKEDVG